MASFPLFTEAQIESLARVLGECGSGSDISRVFSGCGLEDDSNESTKWKRLYKVFISYQQKDKCGNSVVKFVCFFLNPVRFIKEENKFECYRERVNAIFAFSGLEFGKDGKFRNCNAIQTLDEAMIRYKKLEAKLQNRPIHSEVVKYCHVELLQDNYFHAVFEAAKGLAQRIRDKAKVDGDGAALIDRVFSIERPLLAFNQLNTETEKNEHKGLASLFKGCFAAARNPLAHGPKILWQGEEDTADWLSLISLLHRKLDICFPTGVK